MLQSLVYRFVLVISALFITILYNGIVPNWYYIIIVLLYILGFYYFKKKGKSILRLILDFTFINAILWKKDLHQPLLFFFTLIPMINAVNCSGRQRRPLLLLALTVVTIIINSDNYEFCNKLWITIPLISLLLLYGASVLKYREWDVERDITTKVDNYFLSPEKLKSHEIFNAIIKDLNKFFKFKLGEGISRIMVYTLKGETMWLVNSSSFTWERLWALTKTEADELRNKRWIEVYENNKSTYLCYINKYEIEYVFACDVATDKKRLSVWHFHRIMEMSFSKISMLLNTEYRIVQRREEKFNELKDNVLYVNQAVKVMHFIRNKMTPLVNVIAYYKMESKLTPELKTLMKSRFKREVGQAGKDIKDILKYANYLLDKSNNPFADTEPHEVSLSKIFILVSEIAQSQLEISIDADDTIKGTSCDNDIVIHASVTMCKIMLTDWIANMRKNNTGYNNITIRVKDSKLIIHCENSYSMDLENEIQRLVHDMNSNEKDAVLEGKNNGYGIYNIKDIARASGIDLNAKIERRNNNGALLILDFNFSTYERKKNINI